ncbi:MAG: substrate-binding domain-containing protein [Treponema sp.]|nr:substrate-binding domain-containing protein [Treponema sp.]MCL2126655.1 substrate-binding domain-containing protein [Treponema sp.]
MKTVKRIVLLVLLAALLMPATLFAGGKKDAGKVPGQLHFVYVTPLLSHPVWLIAKNGFDQACKELGIRGDWVGPQIISPEEMTKLVDTAIAQKADAIITQGLVPAPPVQGAVEAGIPVLLVDSDLPDVDRLAFFGKDTDVQAQALYDDIVSKLGQNTPLNVAIQVASLSYEHAHNQIRSVDQVFGKHPGGYKLVNTAESKSEKIQSATEWERTFNAYPEINVAINFAAEAGPACATVVKEKGLRSKVLVYAVDDIDETLDLIRSGDLDGTIVTSFFNYGYQATYWLYQHITQGKNPAKVINDAGTIMVNRSNIDNYADKLKVKVDL